jgi:hypothetical protein
MPCRLLRNGGGSKSEQGVRIAVLLVLCLSGVACVDDRPVKCSMHGDCDASVCDMRGFCAVECAGQERGCPNGSYCATRCGLCIRDDNAAPATCAARYLGLSDDEAIAACRGSGEAPEPYDAATLPGCDGSVAPSWPHSAGGPEGDAVMNGEAER